MARLKSSPLAEADLNEILEFIARDKPGAAFRWVQRIRDTCEQLAKQPAIGERRPEFKKGEVRSSLVGNYAIFYRTLTYGIEIARIVRGERDLRTLGD
jgi:toxin ParE1/3/4